MYAINKQRNYNPSERILIMEAYGLVSCFLSIVKGRFEHYQEASHKTVYSVFLAYVLFVISSLIHTSCWAVFMNLYFTKKQVKFIL